MTRAALLACAAIACGGATAAAQGNTPTGRVEVGGGVAWIGQASLGSSDATESTASGPPSTIFRTSSNLSSAGGWGVHVNVRVTSRLEVTGGAGFTRPTIRTEISNDIETSAAVTATERVDQYTFSAGALWYLPFRRPGSRVYPFLSGSAGYLRQLHDMNTLAATGQVYQVGGGAKIFFASRRRSWLKGYGLRGDAGVTARTKGVAFDGGTLYSPSFAASLFVRF